MNCNELEEKLNSLEIKLSYQESTIEELNNIVTGQAKELVIMENHIQHLKRKIEDLEEAGGGDDLPNRRPPHY
ncbi:MAG: SlyX family protein [Sphaerochaetaceae bacterium]|jgi:SlyX protein|nr:SlyX family protein [Sphaerochaetaceae bacterium]